MTIDIEEEFKRHLKGIRLNGLLVEGKEKDVLFRTLKTSFLSGMTTSIILLMKHDFDEKVCDEIIKQIEDSAIENASNKSSLS